MAGWLLAIDFGSTSTAAARRVGDRVEAIELQGGPRMPSMVFWRESSANPDGGRLVLGQEADELSGTAPWCLERSPKRRLGDEFMQLGSRQIRPVEVVAAILREVLDEALSLSGGEPPDEVRLTHPAVWQSSRLEKLRDAALLAGIERPVFIPEPVAAAVHFASARLSVGEHVAVYDLGGGTFDTAVLERTATSFRVVGRPGGDQELGGEDFDDDLYRHLGQKLDGAVWQKLRKSDESRDNAWAQANRELMRQARRAKEGLSRKPEYEFLAPPPVSEEVQASAEEFERLIGPAIRGTVVELERTVLAAKLEPSELTAVYLAGGSSRIPLVGRLVEERMGARPQHLDDPKAVIALGAARLDDAEAETKIQERPTPEVEVTPSPPPRKAPPPKENLSRTPPGDSSQRNKILAAAGGAAVLIVGALLAATGAFSGEEAPAPPEAPAEETAQTTENSTEAPDETGDASTPIPDGPEVVRLALTPPDGGDAGGAAVVGVTDSGQPYVDLALADMPPSAGGDPYLVWFMFDDENGFPLAEAVEPERDGSFEGRFAIPPESGGILQYAIAIEISAADPKEVLKEAEAAFAEDSAAIKRPGETTLRGRIPAAE